MNNKIIIFLAVVFMFVILTGLLPSVSADVEFTIPFDTTYDIKRPCFNNGTYCSATATCNTTISYPDGAVLIDNQLMTNQNSFHNITLNSTDVSQFGIYRVLMTCTDTGGDIKGNGKDTFEIQVTPSGDVEVLGFFILIIVMAYGVPIFGIWHSDISITILGTFMLYGLGIYTLFFGIDIFRNWLTQSFGIVTLGIAMYISVRAAMEYLE